MQVEQPNDQSQSTPIPPTEVPATPKFTSDDVASTPDMEICTPSSDSSSSEGEDEEEQTAKSPSVGQSSLSVSPLRRKNLEHAIHELNNTKHPVVGKKAPVTVSTASTVSTAASRHSSRTKVIRTDALLTEKDARATGSLPFIKFIDRRLILKACGRCAGCTQPDCGKCRACLKNQEDERNGKVKPHARHRCERKICKRVCGCCAGCLAPECGQCPACIKNSQAKANNTYLEKTALICEKRRCEKMFRPDDALLDDSMDGGDGKVSDKLEQRAKLQIEINKFSRRIAVLSNTQMPNAEFEAATKKLNSLKKQMKQIGTRNRKSKIKSRFEPGFHYLWSTITMIENHRKTLAKGVLACNVQNAPGVVLRRKIRDDLDQFLLDFGKANASMLSPQGEETEFLKTFDESR